MGIEDAVLWISFVTGILGTVALVWQFLVHWTGRREKRNKSLSDNILRPWSELQVRESFGPGEGTGLRLWIPKESLPANVAPSTSTDGLDLDRLPGLARAEGFLRKNYPPSFSTWVNVKALSENFTTVRRRRRSVIQGFVRTGMAELGVPLQAVQWEDWGPFTYIFDNIIAEVEDMAYWAAKYGRPVRNIRLGRTSSGEMISFEVSGNYSLLKVPEERRDVADVFVARLAGWTSDAQVLSDSAEMVKLYSELEKAITGLRSALKEIAVAIDMTGR